MARKNGLPHRIRLTWYLIANKNNKHIRTMTCGKCGGIKIKEIRKAEDAKSKKDDITTYDWHDIVICQKCGAICIEYQRWEWKD